MTTQSSINQLTYDIIGAAIEVHKILGKGLLESVYHKCMIEELKLRKINFKSEFKVPINYLKPSAFNLNITMCLCGSNKKLSNENLHLKNRKSKYWIYF